MNRTSQIVSKKNLWLCPGGLKTAEVLEEYADHEIKGLVDVAMAPEPRAPEELPKLMRGTRRQLW